MAGFNHRLVLLSEETLAGLVYFGLRHCRRSCPRPITQATFYDYVTGRQGRVSFSVRLRCEEHARAFVRKYDCEWPTTPADDETPGLRWGGIARERAEHDARAQRLTVTVAEAGEGATDREEGSV
jgi:hypothetical protein